MIKELENETKKLFKPGLAYTDEFNKNWKEYEDHANEVIHKYGWDAVLNSWTNYLHKYCTTKESVCNFAELFFSYTDCKKPVGNPFKWLAWFYHIMDLCPYSYDKGSIIDDMSMLLLVNSGYERASNWVDPYYVPEKDPKLIAEVEKLRAKLSKA